MQTVKDLSVEELRAVIGEVVEEKLREVLNDPDAGLTLRPEIRERLRTDLQEPQEEGQNIPAAELARRRSFSRSRSCTSAGRFRPMTILTA